MRVDNDGEDGNAFMEEKARATDGIVGDDDDDDDDNDIADVEVTVNAEVSAVRTGAVVERKMSCRREKSAVARVSTAWASAAPAGSAADAAESRADCSMRDELTVARVEATVERARRLGVRRGSVP